jgi:hypothetical protein
VALSVQEVLLNLEGLWVQTLPLSLEDQKVLLVRLVLSVQEVRHYHLSRHHRLVRLALLGLEVPMDLLHHHYQEAHLGLLVLLAHLVLLVR